MLMLIIALVGGWIIGKKVEGFFAMACCSLVTMAICSFLVNLLMSQAGKIDVHVGAQSFVVGGFVIYPIIAFCSALGSIWLSPKETTEQIMEEEEERDIFLKLHEIWQKIFWFCFIGGVIFAIVSVILEKFGIFLL